MRIFKRKPKLLLWDYLGLTRTFETVDIHYPIPRCNIMKYANGARTVGHVCLRQEDSHLNKPHLCRCGFTW